MDFEAGTLILTALAVWDLVSAVLAVLVCRAINYGNPMYEEKERREPYLWDDQ